MLRLKPTRKQNPWIVITHGGETMRVKVETANTAIIFDAPQSFHILREELIDG